MAERKKDLGPLDRAILRMQEPSWMILSALDPTRPLPGIEIIRKVEAVYSAAGYPHRHLDPSTLHYSIKRMEEDGLVRREGEQEVEVPGPWGTTRREPRAVYVVTGLGSQALSLHAQLELVRQRAAGSRIKAPLPGGA